MEIASAILSNSKELTPSANKAKRRTCLRIDDTLNLERDMMAVLTGDGIFLEKNRAQSIAVEMGKKAIESETNGIIKGGENLPVIYKCTQCSETFHKSYDFKRHCMSKHDISNPFICPYCDKSYAFNNGLKQHLKTHAEDRPYKCDQCGETFNQSSTLSRHLLRHSGIAREKCPICSKSFILKGDLKTHLNLHTGLKPHKCSECGIAFPRKCNLTRHMRTHTGEKPYKCKYCDKSFARSEKCMEHERTHTNDRPYVCLVCNATFSDSGNYSNHKKNHLNDNGSRQVNSRPRKKRNMSKTIDKKKVGEKEQCTLNFSAQGDTNQNKPIHKQRKRRSNDTVKMSGASSDMLTIDVAMKSNNRSSFFEQLSKDLHSVARNNDNGHASKIQHQGKEEEKQFTQMFINMSNAATSETGFIKIGNLLPTNSSGTGDVNPNRMLQENNKEKNENEGYSNYTVPEFLLNTEGESLGDMSYTNELLTGDSYNLMFDYSRDTSYSFNQDDSLVLADENTFVRATSASMNSSDHSLGRYFFESSGLSTNTMAGQDRSLHDSLFTREGSGQKSLSSVSNFQLFETNTEDQQPLDTSKFLNENYLTKVKETSD